ncbi:MAG: tetratricopeptide repeat protein [Steroidobacteraceae bacterium]
MTGRARRTADLVAYACATLAAAALAPAASSGRQPTIKDLGSRSVQVNPDAKVAGSAARAMENYRRFLELQATDPQLRAEALRRLGDLNLESGELERLEKEVTQIDLQGAEAIKLYSTLLKAYPDYARNDQVLYQLARAYETTGQPEQALATLDVILRRYPRTPQIAEVQFRRGELLFSAKQYPLAEAAYADVVRRGPQAAFYQQSLYKQGWSLFKQSLNEESLPPFAGVLDATLLDAKQRGGVRRLDSLSRPDRELVEDTLRVMSITFSYLDGAESLDKFVAAHGMRPYAHLLYARLGDLYVEKQRFQDAATTYRAFVGRDPNNEYAPGLATQAIEAYRKGGFTQLVLDGKREYVERYEFSTPFWNGRQHADYPTVVAELKTNLKDVAQYFHASAQKSRKIEEYQQAARWYRDFLQSFPSEPDSSGTNYLLAETLYESRQYADAAAEFERTAYQYPQFGKSAAAGYAALVAYQKQEESLGGEAKTAWHRRSIDSAIKFAETFPDHPDSAGVQTRAAQDLFAMKDLLRAISVSETLLARNPPTDTAKQRIAWTIIGQSRYDQGTFDQSEAAFLKARALVPAGDPLQADLTERIASAVYKQGEAKQKAGDGAGAVEDFLRVGRVAPASKIRPTAEYDAATELINLKDWARAIDVLENFRRAYPQSEFSREVARKLAVAYAESGRPGQAAIEFEHMAADPTEDAAVRREAVGKAIELYTAAKDEPKTVAMLERLVADYPSPVADAEEARQRLADIAGQAGNASRQLYWFREIVAADATAGAQRTPRMHYLAARAQLGLAAPDRDQFRAVRLTAPLKKSIGAKKQAMETAIAAYKKANDYGIAEVTTAATYETADLYRTLAKDLLDSERPRKLSKDELEQYNLLLEEQAFPFEEQAIALHEVNLARARDGLFDASVRKSLEALRELKPARYGKTELAQDVIATLAATDPAAVVPVPRAVSDFGRAVAFMQSGNLTEAELALKQLALEWPDLAGPMANLGLLYRRSDRLEDSEKALRAALAHNGANAMLWSELGVSLRMAGKFPDALDAYERAFAADAGYAPAYRNAGVLLDTYLGEPARALEAFERYQALTGEDKPVSGWIAELKRRAGKSPAAGSDSGEKP